MRVLRPLATPGRPGVAIVGRIIVHEWAGGIRTQSQSISQTARAPRGRRSPAPMKSESTVRS
jgi:hypothetical protein